MRRIFVDAETSGLDPSKAQMLSLAVVVEDDGLIRFEKEWLIKQTDWAEIDPYAMDVNKIDLDKHNKVAQDERVVMVELHNAMESQGMLNAIVYGHNVNFDIGFMRAAYKRHNIMFPFTYHFADSMILAIALKDAGIVNFPGFKLQTLCNFYNIDVERFHGALQDARAAFELYHKLLAEIINQRSGEPVKVDDHWDCAACGCSWTTREAAEKCDHRGRRSFY